MYKGKSVLAVITARGGSKGLPGKNTRKLCGKPLIAWTIEQARHSKYIDEIFVTTDSEYIAGVAEEYGDYVPELRPPELATDTASSIDVLLYAIDFMEKKSCEFDYLILLEPTSPLRKDEDIDSIIALGVDNENVNGVISVGLVHTEHPNIVKKISDNGFVVPYVKSSKLIYQRQLEDRAYFPYGVGYLVKISDFKKYKTIYMDHMLPYEIDRWQNYEIDDIYDFMCIEKIIETRGEIEDE